MVLTQKLFLELSLLGHILYKASYKRKIIISDISKDFKSLIHKKSSFLKLYNLLKFFIVIQSILNCHY